MVTPSVPDVSESFRGLTPRVYWVLQHGRYASIFSPKKSIAKVRYELKSLSNLLEIK